MAPSLLRHRPDDAQLAKRVAAGDPGATAALDERYRRPLTRYARTLLRRSEHDAEDVVQDVLIRVHAALVAGEGPQELRPWLYRLTRNRAIDEVRRARWGDEALDEAHSTLHDPRAEPEAVLRRRETLRRVVADLADLPVRQRAALIGRDVDGLSSQEVADQLGVSVEAAQMLAARGREALIKARASRDADCSEVRAQLQLAHERGVRSSEHARRHVAGCEPCRDYARDLRRLSRRLGVLAPPVALGPVAALGKLLGGGVGKPAAAAAIGATAVVAAGGLVVLGTQRHSAGDPAPFELKGVESLVGRRVQTGSRIPAGTAVVTARVRVPAGAVAPGERRSVAMACPSGMRVAGLAAPEQRVPLGYGLSKGTVIGISTKARIDFTRQVLPRSYEATVGVVCRKPGARGSLSAFPREARQGEEAATVCGARQAYFYVAPGRGLAGTVSRQEPVVIQRRSASGRWARIVTDLNGRGWIRASILRLGTGCPPR